MKIKQLSVFLQNKTGSLFDVLDILAEKNINLRALSIADANDFGILRMVVNKPDECQKLLEKNDFIVKTSEIVAIEVVDTPGGLSSILKVLKNNEMDLDYFYAFTHEKSNKAMLLIHTENLKELIKILDLNNIPVVSPSEVYN